MVLVTNSHDVIVKTWLKVRGILELHFLRGKECSIFLQFRRHTRVRKVRRLI